MNKQTIEKTFFFNTFLFFLFTVLSFTFTFMYLIQLTDLVFSYRNLNPGVRRHMGVPLRILEVTPVPYIDGHFPVRKEWVNRLRKRGAWKERPPRSTRIIEVTTQAASVSSVRVKSYIIYVGGNLGMFPTWRLSDNVITFVQP